ncbi:MAG: 4'-phosphopantetheinyl transferase superfamily protein [Desulfobacteraceae bacterium]|nr:4'-phosphopantetheinyl transferase superfamily protein [Desulfobacteraceae bacterium]
MRSGKWEVGSGKWEVRSEKIKDIVAPFLKVESSEITEETIIDKTAIRMSILLRRMYATLAKEGFKISSPNNIRTFGELLNVLDLNETDPPGKINEIKPAVGNWQPATSFLVGIDTEDIKNMPDTDDFREDAFYKQNYSQNEIAYCILQNNPLASFAGKFSAKEAIVKADTSYRDTPFSKIEILNDSDGRPYFNDFVISISHTENHAVAVAIKPSLKLVAGMDQTPADLFSITECQYPQTGGEKRRINRTALFALFISLISLSIAIWDKI